MGQNALVIGGCGFLGSHIVDKLIADNCSVRVLDLCPEKHREPLPAVEYIFKDYGDTFVLSEALNDIDVVYHCASTTVPSTSNRDPFKDIQTNLIPTVSLLSQMIQSGVNKIVFLSSGGTVYGVSESLPVYENHALNPICSYGVVKVAIEKYLCMYQGLYGLKPSIIRPSNPYGPRQGHLGSQGVIATFLHKINQGQPVEVWGDGSVVRDFLYVDDFVEGCMLAAQQDAIGPFNLGSGQGVSINQVIECIEHVTGNSVDVLYKDNRGYDVPAFYLNCNKASSELNWNTKISLANGIARHWAWVKR